MTKIANMHTQVAVPQNESRWDIPASDDEDEDNKARFGSFKSDATKRKAKSTWVNSNPNVPKRIALLYKEIEKNGVLEIHCKCPRKGPSHSREQSQSPSQLQQPQSMPMDGNNLHQTSNTEAQQNERLQIPRPEFKAFDYKDEDERPSSKTPRRTPGSSSVKKPKKIASLSNVVNDIKRFKMLDEIESATLEKGGKKSSKEGKDGKSSEGSKSVPAESISEPKESSSAQISRIETSESQESSKKNQNQR